MEEFTEKELYALGFNKDKGELEGGGSYDWWTSNIETLQIGITYEYDSAGNFEGSYVEIGDVKFYSISKEDFVNLITILRSGKARN